VTGAEIRNEDWVGRELGSYTATGVAFIGVDMSEISTDAATFEDCTFRDVRFNVSQHSRSAFLNCTFGGCNFFESTFNGCKLVGSSFSRCKLDLLKVSDGDWSFVGLAGADLRTAAIDGARMREADLTRARFDGAELRNVDLSGASVEGATFAGADLRGSDLSAFDPIVTELAGAIVDWEQAIVLAAALGLDVRPG
jgi:uncharacterized protein YjbI with pentapeptide repeats